jgi:acetyl/propionyl-CoA carboxylase alpha subunit
LVSGKEFYFLEVNTRVQVEHPITEFITGIDIVKEQISIATGQPLSFKQSDVEFRGHAIECRINAEDPAKGFMPAPGTISDYAEPRMAWVRTDSACYQGYQVLPFYDSLLAKLVIWGRTREEAIARTRLALKEYKIEGVATTIAFHLLLLDDATFQAGEVYTTYVESELKPKYMALPPQSSNPAAQTVADTTRKPPRTFEVDVNQRQFKVAVTEVIPSTAKAPEAAAPVAPTAPIAKPAPAKTTNGNNGGEIRSAMHGLVKELLVKEGDSVSAGQKLVIFEAMKMESEIVANIAGRITSLKVKAGETVAESSVLMLVGE